jgi:hypothetical protein
MNKIKPPTFDDEHKKDEDAETWLLDMRKYFQFHNYSSHAEGIIPIYQLKGKESMWWDHLVQVQHIKEKNFTWREFLADPKAANRAFLWERQLWRTFKADIAKGVCDKSSTTE